MFYVFATFHNIVEDGQVYACLCIYMCLFSKRNTGRIKQTQEKNYNIKKLNSEKGKSKSLKTPNKWRLKKNITL